MNQVSFWEEILNAISTVGFPCAVTIYVLHTHFKKDSENTQVIANNTEALNRLSERLGVDTLE